jgi:hypothetical protein
MINHEQRSGYDRLLAAMAVGIFPFPFAGTVRDWLRSWSVSLAGLPWGDMRDDFDRVMCGPTRRGLYESNYLKANAPSGDGAFWLKYNLMSPTQSTLPAFGELWAVYWPGAGTRPIVVKQLVPQPQLRVDTQRIALHLGPARLQERWAQGEIAGDGHRVSWELALAEGGAPLHHFPLDLFYRVPFPKKKILTPRPRVLFQGKLVVDDQEIPIKDWVGLRGHNWGTEHAHSYAYGNANLWDQAGQWLFDAFSARIQLGPVLSPWLSLAVLRSPEGERQFTHPWRWLNATARADFPSWSCTFEDRKGRARTSWSLQPEDVAGLRYLHPDGRVSYCYNTKFAHLDLELEGRVRDRRTTSLAELEFLSPSPIPGIPLHGEDLLPSL